jgi:3-hydroxyacyl-[acyl-carrier-protein] dehydratase
MDIHQILKLLPHRYPFLLVDRVLEIEKGKSIVALKNVTMNEPQFTGHFPQQPVMPGVMLIEGMAQTAGILVGSVHDFREKVVLAKVASATFERDINPGETLRYDATIERMDDMGASTVGIVDRFSFADNAWAPVGRIELMFSHLDQNRAGVEFPEENFVFGENFRTLLEGAGLRKFSV